MYRTTLTVLMIVLAATEFSCSEPQNAKGQPNFVLILSDDQGWTGLSSKMDRNRFDSKSDYYQTPSLDRFAQEGVRFSRGYAPSATCSPTRHSIQFGMSPARLNFVGLKHVDYDTLNVNAEDGLVNLIKKTRPEYAFAHFGKWHLVFSPEAMGYDESDGSTINDDGDGGDTLRDPKRIFSLTQRSIDFMERHSKAEKPFFLQVSHYADHIRYAARRETIQKYDRLARGKKHTMPLFAAMNEDLDTSVGMLLEKIEELGIADNTYVFYLSDNGFQEAIDFEPLGERLFGKARPLVGSKGYLNEGGLRVPFIVRGPGVAAGEYSSVPVSGFDVLPTVMDILDVPRPTAKPIEGVSIRPALGGEAIGELARDQPFFVFRYSFGPKDFAINAGRFKLMKTAGSDELFLYDLEVDIGEQENLAASMPEKAAEMNSQLRAFVERYGGAYE